MNYKQFDIFKAEIKSNIENFIKNLINQKPLVFDIISQISNNNASAYLVGGAVRDIVLNQPITDIDIEVHGLNLDKLSELLKKFGQVDYVGKSFGVLKLYNLNIDWSLPRIDKHGRKPEVKIDPYLDIIESLKRRDLTINSIALDLISLQLIDPFNGIKDIFDKILRSPDINFFKEDPLRFYRVMQFIPRLNMYPDNSLNKICKNMDISNVSTERIEQEFKKMFLKSNNPSLGIIWLKDIKRLEDTFIELYKTINIKYKKDNQNSTLFEHLMQSLDASTKIQYNNQDEKLIIMFAALCHDLGKINKDAITDAAKKNYDIKYTKSLLSKITKNKKLIKTISILIKYNINFLNLIKIINKNSNLRIYKYLAVKLAPYANLDMLIKLKIAINSKTQNYINIINDFKNNAIKAGVLLKPEKPVLTGKDLINILNPGPIIGKALKYSYKIQINKNIKDKETLKKLTLKHLNLI